MSLSTMNEILESYEGRDKFLKTLSYAAKLTTLFTNSSESSKKMTRFGSKMSECRVILRFFDDASILQEILDYGWGKQENDGIMRLLKLLRNGVELIESPIEHVCWLAEHRFIGANEDFWDNLSTRLWVIQLVLSLLISLIKADRTKMEIDKGSWRCPGGKAELIKKRDIIRERFRNEVLTCARLTLDLSYALSYLPSGYFGHHLKTWQVGLLGTLSSFIGIYQLIKRIRSQSVK